MKVLFVYQFSRNFKGSYMQRIHNLRIGLQQLGVETIEFYLGDSGIRGPTPFLFIASNRLAKEMAAADIVHAGGLGPAGICSLTKQIYGSKTKIIYDIHGDTIGEAILINAGEGFIRGRLRLIEVKTLEFLSHRNVDAAITCSSPLRDLMENRGYQNKPMEVILNGVIEPDRTIEIPRRESEFVITYAGGIHPWQGLDQLAEAMKLIGKSRNIVLRLIGPGRNELERIFDGCVSSKIEYVPWISSKEALNKMMKDSNAFIIPRRRIAVNEVAFPTKFSEFCAAGRPIIVTSVGEIATIVKESGCGIVCDPTAQGLANAIIEMADMDSTKYQDMCLRSHRLAATDLNNSAISARYLRFLESIIGFH